MALAAPKTVGAAKTGAVMVTRINMLTVLLVLGLLGAGAVATDQKPMPPWDGKESIADYAKRVGLEPMLTLDLGGGVKLELVLIPAGKFMMGSPENEKYRQANEGPQHEVTISKAFYMAKNLVTQEQYQKVMGVNPSNFRGAQNPVEVVGWEDAQGFGKKLSATPGKTVRLPTEAEWEYACRAGSTTAFSFGDDDKDLGDYAWYGSKPDVKGCPPGNSNSTSHPVGQKKPNSWGVYDMHSNVWEWCQDWYGKYLPDAATDPQGPAQGTERTVRGGSWYGNSGNCRSAYRLRYAPTRRGGNVGFRVVVEAGATGK